MFSTIKKCEDDDNVVVRLFDMEGKTTEVSLTTFLPVKGCVQTNLIEEPQKKTESKGKQLSIPVGHHSIETYKLTF